MFFNFYRTCGPLPQFILAAILSVSGISSSTAATRSGVDAAIRKATHAELATDPVWEALLGYENDGLLGGKYQSQITSPGFFLHPDGKFNSHAEIAATLEAFFEPPGEIDAHPQCVFRGRYVWLDQQLNLSAYGLAPVNCPAFDSWKGPTTISSMSVLMVSGFLGNPASYYGHNMIKLNASNPETVSLEDSSINFGADIPAGDGILKYIAKGISGGYQGLFSSSDYFHFAHNYGENELRDIWEYELDLSEPQLELMIAYLWELLEAEYTYYFLTKNCAFRMAKLLNVLLETDLTQGSALWYTPQTFILNLNAINSGKPSLVKKIAYHPSRQSRFYYRHADLTTDERNAVKAIVGSTGALEAPRFATLETQSQYRVLDVLMDYYQYVGGTDDQVDYRANESYRRILSKRYSLEPGESIFSVPNVVSPHQARDVSYFSTDIIRNSSMGTLLKLDLRPAYYDQIDYDAGHVAAAALSMGEIELAISHEGTTFRKISIVKIESVNSNATGLPGDDRNTWSLEFGGRQEHLASHSSFVADIKGAIGRAYRAPVQDLVLGWRIGSGAQQSYDGSGPIFGSAAMFLSGSFSDHLRMHIHAEQKDFISSAHLDRMTLSITLRYQWAQNADIRFTYEKNMADEVGLRVGYYW